MIVKRLYLKNHTSELWNYRASAKIMLRCFFIILVFGLSSVIYISGCVNEAQKPQNPSISKTTDRVEFLIDELKDNNVSVRKNAAETLGKIGDTRAVEPLIATLKDEDWNVRRSAAYALDRFGWQAKDEKEKVAYLIAQKNWDELVKIGTLAVDPLITALKDKDSAVRQRAAEALGKIRTVYVRESAAGTLEKVGKDTRAVKPLIAALKDEDWNVRNKAAYALDGLGWQAKDEKEKVVYLIAQKNWYELVKIGTPAVEPLIASLKDKESDVRGCAAGALGNIKDTSAVEPLIAALKDEEMYVRRVVSDALGKIGDTRAVEPLIIALNDKNAYYVETIHTPPNLFEYHRRNIRRFAAEALGNIGDNRAVEPLIAALKDKDDDVRSSAAEALIKIGDRRAVLLLVPFLKNWYLGTKLANALQKFAWQPQSIEDQVHYAVAMRDKSSLTKTWEQTKSVLLEDVLSNEYSTIENALYAFIGIGRQDIIPDLIKTLNSKGNKTIAEAYLNCGQKELDSAAREWASKHGYNITAGSGVAPIGWGLMW